MDESFFNFWSIDWFLFEELKGFNEECVLVKLLHLFFVELKNIILDSVHGSSNLSYDRGDGIWISAQIYSLEDSLSPIISIVDDVECEIHGVHSVASVVPWVIFESRLAEHNLGVLPIPEPVLSSFNVFLMITRDVFFLSRLKEREREEKKN